MKFPEFAGPFWMLVAKLLEITSLPPQPSSEDFTRVSLLRFCDVFVFRHEDWICSRELHFPPGVPSFSRCAFVRTFSAVSISASEGARQSRIEVLPPPTARMRPSAEIRAKP